MRRARFMATSLTVGAGAEAPKGHFLERCAITSRPGSMLANRSPNKTRALCPEKYREGSPEGGNTTEGGFFVRQPFPTRMTVFTGVRRGQGSARETLRRENPERGSRPGVPELSLILGSRPYGGVSGRWGAVQPAHERQQHLCRGMGVPYSSPNNTRLKPAHRHIPLCVWGNGPVLRFRVNRYGGP